MAQDPGCSPGTPAYAEAALGSVSSSREDTRRGTAPEKPSPVCSGLPTTNTARAALRFYQPVTGTCKSCSGSSATRWARADGLSCTQLARSGLPQNSRGPVGSFACLACSAFLSFPGQQVLCCAARGHIPSHPIPLHPTPSHPTPSHPTTSHPFPPHPSLDPAMKGAPSPSPKSSACPCATVSSLPPTLHSWEQLPVPAEFRKLSKIVAGREWC